jgi:hypothetical protein
MEPDEGVAVDSSIDSAVDSQVDAGCVEGVRRCQAGVGVREECRAGTWVEIEVCDLGCHGTFPRCNRLSPSNDISSDLFDDAVSPLAPTQDIFLDTDTGIIEPNWSGTPVVEFVGPYDCGVGKQKTMAVFVFSSVTVPEGVTVRLRGSNAAAILSPGPIEINGVIDVSGGVEACDPSGDPAAWCAGPGGFEGGRGDTETPTPGSGPGGGGAGFNESPTTNDETGGGGGGHGGLGGAGGDENDDDQHPGGDGGASYGTTTLTPLCGGSGGGAGGPANVITSVDSSHGGGGGGAIQIVSEEMIVVSCAAGPCGVRAGGGGGYADHEASYDDGGGGGGAGGAILLEAPEVTVGTNGVLAAGGGGGAGGYNDGEECNDGESGPLAGVRASGGAGTLSGGDGGGVATGSGESADPGGDGTGGGGGGAGWVRVNTYNQTPIGGTMNPTVPTGLASTGAVAVE